VRSCPFKISILDFFSIHRRAPARDPHTGTKEAFFHSLTMDGGFRVQRSFSFAVHIEPEPLNE